jgi:hypothetical protein
MIQSDPSAQKIARHPRNRKAAQRFVEACQIRGKITFTLAELQKATGLSFIAARDQVKRLGQQVARVSPRQDFFLIVSPEQFPMGAPPAFWWLDSYFQLIEQPYYVGLLTAAVEYGSSHQAVQVTQVLTNRPLRELKVGRVRVQFFVRSTTGTAPALYLPGAYAPLKISTPEVTALDLIRYAYRIGGASRVVQVLRDLLPKFSKKRLQTALAAELETSNIQRLGFILEELGRPDLCELVRAKLPSKVNWVLLEHHNEQDGGISARKSNPWSVIVNADIRDLS